MYLFSVFVLSSINDILCPHFYMATDDGGWCEFSLMKYSSWTWLLLCMKTLSFSMLEKMFNDKSCTRTGPVFDTRSET